MSDEKKDGRSGFEYTSPDGSSHVRIGGEIVNSTVDVTHNGKKVVSITEGRPPDPSKLGPQGPIGPTAPPSQTGASSDRQSSAPSEIYVDGSHVYIPGDISGVTMSISQDSLGSRVEITDRQGRPAPYTSTRPLAPAATNLSDRFGTAGRSATASQAVPVEEKAKEQTRQAIGAYLDARTAHELRVSDDYAWLAASKEPDLDLGGTKPLDRGALSRIIEIGKTKYLINQQLDLPSKAWAIAHFDDVTALLKGNCPEAFKGPEPPHVTARKEQARRDAEYITDEKLVALYGEARTKYGLVYDQASRRATFTRYLTPEAHQIASDAGRFGRLIRSDDTSIQSRLRVPTLRWLRANVDKLQELVKTGDQNITFNPEPPSGGGGVRDRPYQRQFEL